MTREAEDSQSRQDHMRNERLEPAPSDAPADAVGKSTPSAETIEALEALMRSTSDPEGADLPNLRDVSDPEERDRLLAAALAYAEMQEARYRVSADTGAGRRLKGSLATVLFLLALLILARPPTLLVPAALPVASEAEQLRGARIALLLQAQQIEAFRSRENRLPESLAELDNPLPDLLYLRPNDRLYQLVAYTPDRSPVVYESSARGDEFDAIGSGWITTRAGF